MCANYFSTKASIFTRMFAKVISKATGKDVEHLFVQLFKFIQMLKYLLQLGTSQNRERVKCE